MESKVYLLYWRTVWTNQIPLRSWCEQGISLDPGDRWSEAIGCTCDVLPQLAAISQLGGDIRGLQLSCSDGCVFSGSQRHQLAPCVFCLGLKSGLSVWDFFLLSSFYIFCFPPWSVTPTSPLVFGSSVFCLSIILIDSVGGGGFYSHCHLLDTKRPQCLHRRLT